MKLKDKLPKPIIKLGPQHEIPRGYGIAWYNFKNMYSFAMPFPLFIIVGLSLRLYFRIMTINMTTEQTKIYRQGVLKGKESFEQGRQLGRKEVLVNVERELNNHNMEIDETTFRIMPRVAKSSEEMIKEMEKQH